MKQQIIHVVAGVISDSDGRILACQRPEGKALAGSWEFPGGKVEPGETLCAALRRELAEELALEVVILDEMYQLSVVAPDNRKLVLHFIRALLKSGSKPASCEQQSFKWVEKSELEDVPWLETDREFVDYLTQQIS